MTKRARRAAVAVGSPTAGARATSGRFAVRPGTFNLAGELFTPAGARLTRRKTDISVETAAELVRAGAELAYEVCGCGGGGPCKPVWPERAAIAVLAKSSLPSVSARPTAPTWMDVWAGDGVTAVFCHGDITWGSALP
ncbi:hypothetical protein C1N91_11855 [Curtobacterium sp. SGAir0471]|uniref:hypothetical protein n=1 Tax=Curtobacterium sp. SGAir0471 TaxID=2070337 RepID=UPI0010CCDC34|nr:hypothetical protein [Curtobacterium sp. SGAir0471]QCR44112.1 hypothetical protein C1N91_11855 [Curtobacterium sp. SGAir0471]